MKQTPMMISATTDRLKGPAPLDSSSFRSTYLTGFTFIELILVVLIFGVLIGLAMPRLQQAASAIELDNFAKNIYALSRFLQGEAIHRSQVYCLTIDEAGVPSFQARLQTPDPTSPNRLQDIPGHWGRVRVAPQGVEVSLQPNDQSEIYFYPDGSSDTVTIIFKNEHGDTSELSIQGTAGQIKIS